MLIALLAWMQGDERGEGLVISGLPLGSFADEVQVQPAAKGASFELPTEAGSVTVTLSFWLPDSASGTWRASGTSRLRPDGLVQRLELHRVQTDLIFLDDVGRGAELVEGWQLGRIGEEGVQVSSAGKSRRLELEGSLPLGENWCATLLGLSLPPEPSQAYANEVTEPKADLLLATCDALD